MTKTLLAISTIALLASTPLLAQDGDSQRERHARGEYDTAAPYSGSLGIQQDAWQNPNKNLGSTQQSPGYSPQTYAPDRVLKARTRTGMITSVRLPAGEIIDTIVVGDPHLFIATPQSQNLFLIQPRQAGADTNIVITAQSGLLYNFYVSSEDHKSNKITDLLVDVLMPKQGIQGITTLNQTGLPLSSPAGVNAGAGVAGLDSRLQATWLKETIGFKPENIVHDLGIYVPENTNAVGIIPERVFRDQNFTYIDYGDQADSMTEWPVVSLVIQGVETPVQFDVAGPQGRMIVVKAIGDLSLRNGLKIVCIKQETDGYAKNRGPAPRIPVPGTVQHQPVQFSQNKAPFWSKSAPAQGSYALALAEGSPQALRNMWASLKVEHFASYPGLTPTFVAANALDNSLDGTSNPNNQRLIVGPFADQREAIRICQDLGNSNIACQVVKQ